MNAITTVALMSAMCQIDTKIHQHSIPRCNSIQFNSIESKSNHIRERIWKMYTRAGQDAFSVFFPSRIRQLSTSLSCLIKFMLSINKIFSRLGECTNFPESFFDFRCSVRNFTEFKRKCYKAASIMEGGDERDAEVRRSCWEVLEGDHSPMTMPPPWDNC